MADDNTFRLILLIVVAIVAPRAIYRRLRSFTGERLDRWQEGAVILLGLRLSAVPVFLGIIAWLINPQWREWSSLPLPAWARWVGVAIVACAGLLLLWTFRNLGKNLTDTVVT